MNVFVAHIESGTAVLNEQESLHCAKVLRMKTGEEIELIDGKGNFYKGKLSKVGQKNCVAQIISGPVIQPKRNYYLHLAIAPTKQIDRVEWMVEKAVETGIDEITFIKCKNSERVKINLERIQKITESAVKQSLQAFIPRINGLINFAEMMNVKTEMKLIAHCHEGKKSNLKEINFKNKSVLILIGPEGDFNPEEITLALQNNFTGVNLGNNRLRTETAGLYVCQTLSILT